MNKSDSIKNLAASMAKFQGLVQNPKNTADNPFFKSKYAPLNDILTMIRPLMAECGLSILQSPSGDGTNIVVSTILMHESGEWIEPEPLILKADKATAQGAGSAITYARRYAISAILGISSEDDDDGNHASDNKPQQKSQPQPQQPKQQPKQQQKPKPEPQATAGDDELEITMADYDKIEPISTPRALTDKPRKALHAIRNELNLDEAKFKQLITETCLPKLASEFGFIPFKVNSLNDLAILDEVVIETLIRGLNTVAKQQKQPNGGLGQTVCANCHNPISEKVFKFSSERYGKGLCMDCQKTHQQGAK